MLIFVLFVSAGVSFDGAFSLWVSLTSLIVALLTANFLFSDVIIWSFKISFASFSFSSQCLRYFLSLSWSHDGKLLFIWYSFDDLTLDWMYLKISKSYCQKLDVISLSVLGCQVSFFYTRQRVDKTKTSRFELNIVKWFTKVVKAVEEYLSWLGATPVNFWQNLLPSMLLKCVYFFALNKQNK